MRILTLDIGIDTGCAVLESPTTLGTAGNSGQLMPSILHTRTIHRTDLSEALQHLEKEFGPYDQVFFEEPIPQRGKLGDDLRKAILACRYMYPGATNIAPGQWKSYLYIARMNLPLHVDATQHEKDATRLGIYCFQMPGIVGLREYRAEEKKPVSAKGNC